MSECPIGEHKERERTSRFCCSTQTTLPAFSRNNRSTYIYGQRGFLYPPFSSEVNGVAGKSSTGSCPPRYLARSIHTSMCTSNFMCTYQPCLTLLSFIPSLHFSIYQYPPPVGRDKRQVPCRAARSKQFF